MPVILGVKTSRCVSIMQHLTLSIWPYFPEHLNEMKSNYAHHDNMPVLKFWGRIYMVLGPSRNLWLCDQILGSISVHLTGKASFPLVELAKIIKESHRVTGPWRLLFLCLQHSCPDVYIPLLPHCLWVSAQCYLLRKSHPLTSCPTT